MLDSESRPEGVSPDAAGGCQPRAPVEDPNKVFDLFLESNRRDYSQFTDTPARQKGRLSNRSATVYRSFWGAYVRWLAGRNRKWYEATPLDVEKFLESVEARSKREKKASDAGKRNVSIVTEQRYTRVFERIYQFALTRELHPQLTGSPASVKDDPTLDGRENIGSFMLLNPYRARVLDGIRTDVTGLDARDHAMVALMGLEGLTPREVASIRCTDLSWQPGKEPGIYWWIRLDRWDEAPAPVGLKIRPTGEKLRGCQERELDLSKTSSLAIQSWIRWRGPYVPAAGSGRDKGSNPAEVLMCGPKGELSNQVIYSVVKNHLVHTLVRSDPGGGGQLKQMRHMGPMVLRTMAVMSWLEDGLEVEAVLKRAGLGQAKSLRRFIEHSSTAVKERLEEAISSGGGRDGALARSKSSSPGEIELNGGEST